MAHSKHSVLLPFIIISDNCIPTWVTISPSQMEEPIPENFRKMISLTSPGDRPFSLADPLGFQVHLLHFWSAGIFSLYFKITLPSNSFSFQSTSDIFLSRSLFVVHLKSAHSSSGTRIAGEDLSCVNVRSPGCPGDPQGLS